MSIDPSSAAAHYYLAESLLRIGIPPNYGRPNDHRALPLASYHYQQAIKWGPDSSEAAEAQTMLDKLHQGVDWNDLAIH